MSMGSKILNFLFGKDPDIFDDRGNVLHHFQKTKWDAWQDRFRKDSNYNFRKHVATETKSKENTKKN